MTVQELIKKLKKLPSDYEVWFDTGEAFGEQADNAYVGFVTEPSLDGWRGTLWHSAEEFDEVEADEKHKVVVIS